MSFMFNPHPYDDPTPVNRPKLTSEIIDSIISGTKETANHLSDLIIKRMETNSNRIVLALDGYISAQFDQIVNLIFQSLKEKSIQVNAFDVAKLLKSSDQLEKDFSEHLKEDLEKDPVLLFGKLFKRSYIDLFDNVKYIQFENDLKNFKNGTTKEVLIVYGFGCTVQKLRISYDIVAYLDVTPKETILRAKKGRVKNLGEEIAKPFKPLMRRCYYVDFEVASHLRWELIKEEAFDYYIFSNDPDYLKMIPRETFNSITASLVQYPMRCKPVYLEGVWGGHYIKNLRNLPETMSNCAWVFDLIPLEVSLLVEAGKEMLEFPFFTFVQKQGESLMGRDCVERFGGYFPIRFNYDDSYHSSGNMSIQVHSGHQYNIDNYGEHGRQDESYYIIATGHGAKTYIGFNEDADPEEFIREAKKSEKEFTPIDYQKYINHVPSKPGVQVLLPAGTIHSSGRNQVVLEIGSLTIGSYTYKMYDYLRSDLDGKPRPIHTFHGENVLRKERNTTWVKENLVQSPQLIKSGEDWFEYIVGEHDLLYFSLRRLEFKKTYEGDTEGKFHVLNLIDGEKVLIQSLDKPELCYTQNYLDVVLVPANVGKYKITNLGNQPVIVHKTMLKDGFENENIPVG